MLSIDLEDNFCDLPYPTWTNYESRVVNTTKVILDLLRRYNTRATFFTVGYIAERHPQLVESLIAEGHEIASHSYSHPNLKNVSKDSFESDLESSLDTLRRLSGEKVLGFRAPYFSVSRQNFWIFDIMKRRHLLYDSSIFPVGPHYGFADAPRYPYRMSDEDPLKEDANSNFIEIPPATLKLPILGNAPVAGGFYLRFLPFQLIKMGIRKLNASGHNAMCYIHPEDLAPDRPRLPGYTWHYYWGLDRALKKFEALLKNFRFSSVREVLLL
jgi:polysaccharide deacetylase family protein (PEP-CTERM system associated)